MFCHLFLLRECAHRETEEADDYEKKKYHHPESCQKQKKRYLLYDVNYGEGFNLRRDVYMRIAVFVKNLQDLSKECTSKENSKWILVLPPWGPLHHWQSRSIKKQYGIPWSRFFDLDSLTRFVDVIEFHDYLKQRFGEGTKEGHVDKIVYLQNFPFDGNWENRILEENCKERNKYEQDDDERWRGFFWGYQDTFYGRDFTCLSAMGHASVMKDYLLSSNSESVLLDRAEVLLHDDYGDKNYWSARRSMVFAAALRAIGDEFREMYLNSTDQRDGTVMSDDWREDEKKAGEATGGPYLAVHLRRKDYLHAKSKEVPTLKSAAIQTKNMLNKLNLSKVYVSTDAPADEVDTFTKFLKKKKTSEGEVELPFSVHRFSPTEEELVKLGDGGVAIVDQWIASHAQHFIGTHESTFTFRIQEERQILGLHPDSIFNRFCGSNKECERPSKWLIVY